MLHSIRSEGNGPLSKEANLFEDILSAELSALQRRARALAKDADAAEDLLQDTLEHAFRGLASFKPGTNARAWLNRIMRNVWISDHRHRSTRPAVVSLDDTAEGLIAGERSQVPPEVEAVIIDRLSAGVITAAIERLPSELRQVMALLTEQGESYDSIASELAIPRGTVCSRIWRARRRLKAALSEQRSDVSNLARAA